MQNILLRYCRETNGYSPKLVASKLGISARKYAELEKGETLLTPKQARQLGDLYHSKARFFYEAAAILDLALTSRVNAKILKADNERLKEMLILNGVPLINRKELVQLK